MENTYPQPAPTAATSLAMPLADLWQAEEAVGHRLDAWLLAHLRSHGSDQTQAASEVRRGYHRARRELRVHLRALGRDVVRLPILFQDASHPARPDAAARGLQRLHRELSRANARLNRLSRMATLRREHKTAQVLSALHEAQLDTLELVRELFQAGQARSREALRQTAA